MCSLEQKTRNRQKLEEQLRQFLKKHRKVLEPYLQESRKLRNQLELLESQNILPIEGNFFKLSLEEQISIFLKKHRETLAPFFEKAKQEQNKLKENKDIIFLSKHKRK